MVETRLAEQIGASRTPVREALHMLEMESFLEAVPGTGYRVKRIEWNEMEEICEIRAVNETLAARRAMKRISLKELQALEKNIAIAEAEVRAGNPEAFVERDAQFHEILLRASGSKRLFEFCRLLRRHMLRYRIENLCLRETALRAIKGHRRIMACLMRKDGENIESAIGEHLEQTKHDIQRYAGVESYEKDTALSAENE